jgi:hypothetical protein
MSCAKALKTVMTIQEVKDYFLARCDELVSLAERGDPWVFLCGSAMIDYLTQMTTSKAGRIAYIEFVDTYFRQINIKYKEFEFQNGQRDLPTQMYIILRCGIVHKFSFVPNQQGIDNGGRKRSILVAHEKNGHTHLTAYTKNGIDSIIFTAEQFSKDIKSVVEVIFSKALNDNLLEAQIKEYASNYPPIMAGFR